jgi:uncharacterized protein YndB with AHSA1/START domain
MENKTKIIAEAGKQELFIHRIFDAPVEKVYQAFSAPEILVKFFAPKGIDMVFLEPNYHQGGFYRYRHTDAKGNIMCTFKGVVHEMTAPQRIVITSEFEELPEPGHVVLEIYDFTPLPDNKTKLVIQDICRSVEDRDAMIQSGMEGGLVSIFNNLDDFLKKESGSPVVLS